MQLLSHRNDEEQIYIDENQKIKWIRANMGLGHIKTLVQKTQWPVKVFVITLIAGLLAGAVLSLI